jgi:hypothetical protein
MKNAQYADLTGAVISADMQRPLRARAYLATGERIGRQVKDCRMRRGKARREVGAGSAVRRYGLVIGDADWARISSTSGAPRAV